MAPDADAGTPFARLRALLPDASRSGSEWKARCPAHDDLQPSLSFRETETGQLLFHCHTGCHPQEILLKLGLSWQELLGGNTAKRSTQPRRRQAGGVDSPSPNNVEHSNTLSAGTGLTLDEYAAAKQLPADFLHEVGVSDLTYNGRPAIRMLYRAADGTERAVRFRLALHKAETGDNRFCWRKGAKPLLYGLWRLDAARQARHVVLVEGESDTQTLWHYNIPALGLPGANSWHESWAGELADIPIVYVVIEPDRGGEAVCDWLARSALRDRVRLVHLGEYKDPSALHVADPSRFRERWAQIIAAAVPWQERARAAAEAIAQDALKLAGGLLDAPDVLDRVGHAMRERGWAGDLEPPMLVYIALTSRLLDRPMNIAVVAASSSGKNRAVDAATDLVPPEAIHVEKAGSARTLIYCDAVFEHRVVIVEEADSIPEDGPAASAVRALASDNEMVYDVVEKDPESGRFAVRRILKPGPTGLITTSTRSLGPQMGTRVLEIPVPDDPTQTRAVLHAHAKRVRPRTKPAVDLAPFLAVQRYLAVSGVRQVDIPFADTLADLVPAKAVRMRRDFAQLLTCIQAVALLHQRQRRRTPEGWIEAVLDDYAMARRLLAPIFDTIATEGVTTAIRDTVNAVKDGESVSANELAKRLKRENSTISWRVKRAIQGGWLVNHETRQGHAARLALGTPLPEAAIALPTVRAVQKAFESSNASRDEVLPPPPPPVTPEAEECPRCHAIPGRAPCRERSTRESPGRDALASDARFHVGTGYQTFNLPLASSSNGPQSSSTDAEWEEF